MTPLFRSHALLVVCLGLVVLTGCRSYGTTDSRRAHLAQIQEANRIFEGDLQRMRQEEQRFRQAAATDPWLRGPDQELSRLVEKHQHLLEQHRVIERRNNDRLGSHRDLSRALQAIVGEHEMMRDAYDRLFRQHELAPLIAEIPLSVRHFEEGRYFIAPPMYERLRRQMQPATVDLLVQGPRRPIQDDLVEPGETPAEGPATNGDAAEVQRD
jgi:hypothetical protein